MVEVLALMGSVGQATMPPTRETPTGVVLRLLGGEGIDRISQETRIPVSELQRWVRAFVDAGAKAVKHPAERTMRQLAKEERRKTESRPAALSPVVDPDLAAPRLPVAEHLHQLWIALGLGDED